MTTKRMLGPIERSIAALAVLLLACDRPEAAQPAEPSVTVTYPSARDTLVEGETYVIRWQASGIDSLAVSAALGGKDKGHLAFSLPAQQESLSWTVPAGFVSGVGLSSSSDVHILLEARGNSAIVARSEPFTITVGSHP